jgi:microtubule-associated protein-like 6
MGQQIGKASLPERGLRFLNLPKRCIYELWTAFNDIAEGFGLTVEEFNEILKNATMEHLQATERTLAPEIDALFRSLDDDENRLVDSLEFIAGVAFLSAMTPEEKIRFVFAMYDFDESGILTLDEMVLAFRSCLSGACKICRIDPPLESEIENTVGLCFDNVQLVSHPGAESSAFSGVDRESFVLFCLGCPDVTAWIENFDDLIEYHSQITRIIPPITLLPEYRTEKDEALKNPTLGGMEMFKMESDNKPGPNKSWKLALPFLNNIRGAGMKTTKPTKNLLLEWVYGYNGHSSRQSLFYSAMGEIIYPAAALVVIENVAKHEQRHFNQHYDLITALAIFSEIDGGPNPLTIVASGERGFRPTIHVWDATTLDVLSTLVGFHRGGISILNFSPSREKLVTMGIDPYHSMAIYRWRTSELLFTARTSPDLVHDARFLTEDIVASCGVHHVTFWRRTHQEKYRRFRGVGNGTFKPEEETFFIVGAIGELVYSGSERGYLQIWEGRNWMRSIKAHTSPIMAQATVGKNSGIVTACSVGKVLVWNDTLEIIAQFNISSLGPVLSGVVALCYDQVNSRILVGLQSCEIFEMDAMDGRNLHSGGSVVSGHFHPRVAGISAHPHQAQFICTVGDDRTIRVFDVHEHRQFRLCELDSKAHSVSYNATGQGVLVGIGSGVLGQEEPKEGAFMYINPEDMTLIHEARDAKQMVTDIKYSPDGSRYAIACADGAIYLYNAEKMHTYAICRGHIGKVTHIDYSNNGAYLMSNSDEGELLFWETHGGQQQAPKSVKGLKWESNSCVYSFGTQCMIADDERYVRPTVSVRTKAEDLIVMGNSSGILTASQYPCFIETGVAATSKYTAHAKGIANLAMSCDDKLLFSLGETDGCVIQWRIKDCDIATNEDLKRVEGNTPLLIAEAQFSGKQLEKTASYEDAVNYRIQSICELEEGIQEPKNLMPWQKFIVSPSKSIAEDNSEPPDSLELEYVYGVTTDICRQPLHYTAKGEIAFFSANIAVIMTQSTRAQRFFREHSCKILCMHVNKVHDVVATGDFQRIPKIYIWSTEHLRTVVTLRGYHRRGVSQVRFSSDGRFLATIGLDTLSSLAIYDWRNQTIIVASQTFTNKVFALDFNPNGTGLVQCGQEVIRFWTVHGHNLQYQDAIYANRAKLQGFLCIGWIGGNVVVGTTDGSLYRFLAHRLESIVQGHNGPVNALSSAADGICSAGSDGVVKIWTRFLECRLVIELKHIRAVVTHARCVDWDYDNGRILFATPASEVFEISAADGESIHRGALLEGHGGDGELWGLSVNPTKEEFCTVGDDMLLRIWDITTHRCVNTMGLEMPARCCAYSPDGKKIAIGFGGPRKVIDRQFDGKWIVIDTADYEICHEARDSSKWLREIKYSPNGKYIGIGGEDNKLYVYNVEEGYNLCACIAQHQSFILSFDFSDDSAWLRSNCAGFELCFFESETGLFIPSAARLRDVTWASQNCSMDWNTQGVWSPYRDGTDITYCESNSFRGEDDGQVLVTGDNFGRLKMFRYPCTNVLAIGKKYWAGAQPITRIRFASGDASLLTLAGADKSILQWRHHRDREDLVAYQTSERRTLLEEEEDDVANWMLAYTDLNSSLENMANELKQLTSVRPWIGAIIEPSNYQINSPALLSLQASASQPLLQRLALEHVFAHNQTSLARRSLFYNPSNPMEIVYPASRYVVVMHKAMNRQRFYRQHKKEVCALTLASDGSLAASAEKTLRPLIHIWDCQNCEQVNLLSPNMHRRGVISLMFNSDHTTLLSLGRDHDAQQSLAIWRSSSGAWHEDGCTQCVSWYTSQADIAPILFTSFYETTIGANHFLFVTGGRFHVKFWVSSDQNIAGYSNINPLYPEYPKTTKLSTILCGHRVGKKFMTGSTAGHIMVWIGRTLDRIIRAHEKGVSVITTTSASYINHLGPTAKDFAPGASVSSAVVAAMSATAASQQQQRMNIITAGKEGIIKIWTQDFEHLQSFSIAADADILPLLSTIRSLDVQTVRSTGQEANERNPKASSVLSIIAGMASGEMYEIFVLSGHINLLSEAHFQGELHGLDVHPYDPDTFVTVSDDMTLRVWSVSQHKVLKKAVFDCTTRCVAYSPDGGLLVVGLGGRSDGARQRKDGAFILLDAQSLKPRYEGRYVIKAADVFFRM